MQLASEVFDCREQTRRGPVDGFADYDKLAVLYCLEQTPARALGQRVHVPRHLLGMTIGKDQELRLQADHLFEADVRPVLRRLNHGSCTGMSECIGDEGVFADGDKRIGPYDEERASRRNGLESLLQQPFLLK